MFRVALLLVLLCSPALADRLAGARSLSDTDWGYEIIDSPTRAGAQAQRFEVRPGDCAANSGWDDCTRDRERSEFRPDLEWQPGTPMWIGFSVFLPPDFASVPQVSTTLAQIHQRGGPIRVAGGLVSRPPVMQIETRGEDLRLTVHVPGHPNIRRDLASVADLRGQWTDLVIAFFSGPEPHLRVWVNDRLRAEVVGWDSPPPRFFYFKYGLYRSFVSRNGGPMPRQVAYFDEVRMSSVSHGVMLDLAHPVD